MAAMSSPALTVPPTQNTAPVLEFRCLWTQDLRRKQKRWQDGRLKFHTFNKRVMVYDERSNFVGDTHWKESLELNEGEELELERGGVLVEVGECIGKRDQDLSELVDKRVKEKEARAAAKAVGAPPSRQALDARPQFSTPVGAQHLKPKSLDAVIGTPTGHYGRAMVSSLSPFEQRQQENQEQNTANRLVKRRKLNEPAPSKNGYAQNLMGATLNLASARPLSTATIQHGTLRPSIQRSQAVTIDLTDNDREDYGSSKAGEKPQPLKRSPPAIQKRKQNSPPRSSYASNLTGAALSLCGPKVSLSKPPKNNLSASTDSSVLGHHDDDSDSTMVDKPLKEFELTAREETTKSTKAKQPEKQKDPWPKFSSDSSALGQHGDESSCFVAQNPSNECERLWKRETMKPAKAKQSERKEEPKTKPQPTHSPSPPLRDQQMNTASKQARRRKEKNSEDSTATGIMSEKPLNALRIKARPPRKMMMLIGLPSSLSSAPNETTLIARTMSKPKQTQAPVMNEVVLSQATMHLNSFCQKQEELLEARLNGRRVQAQLDLDDSSSSPMDAGIDHHMIDTILTREKSYDEAFRSLDHSSAAQISRTSRVSNKTPTESDEGSDTRSRYKQPDRNSSSNNIGQLEVLDLPGQSPNTATKTTRTEQKPKELGTQVSTYPSKRKLTQESNATADSNDERTHPKASVTASDYDQTPEALRDRLPVSANNEMEKTRIIGSRISELAAITAIGSDSNAIGETVTGRADPEGVRSAIPIEADHFSNNVMPRTDHTRLLVNTSVPQSDQVGIELREAEIEDPVLTPCRPPAPRRFEQLLGAIAIRPSPETSPPAISRTDSVLTGSGSTTNLGQITKVFEHQTTNPPKARLVNPATRGQTVRFLASKTVDSMTPAFMDVPGMPPPFSPQVLTRPEWPVAESITETGRPMGEPQVLGPWSRESFDLFGSWRPPEKASGTNASVAGR
jgi:hypothetical protein